MYQDINSHKAFVVEQLAKLRKHPNKEILEELLAYHDVMTRNFQHERQIHLFVTFFFGALMLASWFLLAAAYVSVGNFLLLLVPLALLVLILTILEAFYVRHYYRLENRTQKLYKLADEIYQLIEQVAKD